MNNLASDVCAAHADLMARNKAELRSIVDLALGDRPIVYLDYPLHDNVGDLLIHWGTDAFFEDNKLRVLGRYSLHDFCEREVKSEPEIRFKRSVRDLDLLVGRHQPALVFHGGGNFGDLYPEFQYFREMIIERYPNSRIVILPQSIQFQQEERRQVAADHLRLHKDIFVFVRDKESLTFVRDQCGVRGELMPDMAHQLWGRLPLDRPPGQNKTLILRRRDKETVGIDNGVDNFDWGDLLNGRDKFIIKAIRRWQTVDNPLRHVFPNYRIWQWYRDELIARGVEKFGHCSLIDTDRLHGMILGALMARQVRYGDGTYGKLNRYARLWLDGSPLIQSATASTI